ncbi:hypothetical protein [Dehalobacterium formicoaceticum]|uniref:hypothetical protein n=1 Tax=Dehalobacterium formicoaceticum TaxID=51515 RepID=UPI000B7E6305|nr:hypothetical protein [Dehalobacterium formicoaceticum]
MKKITETIEVDLNYFIGKQDELKGIFNGGVKEPLFTDELKIDVSEDEIFDETKDDFVKNGKINISIAGTDNALYELGKFLIAISRYETLDKEYHEHLDNIRNSNQQHVINLTIRKG